MTKDAFYFPHDAGARNDERMLTIRAKYGWEGYGWYFGILELLRESSDYTLSRNVINIKMCLGISSSDFENMFQLCFDIKLFKNCDNDNTRFHSESFTIRMKIINNKRQKLVDAGRAGGLAKSKKINKKDGIDVAMS